jgi:serine protease Do
MSQQRTILRAITLSLSVFAAAIQVARPTCADDLQPPAAVAEFERQRVAMIERASAATVMIFDESGNGGGSGVLISADGFAVTNFHVAKPAGLVMKCGLNDGKIYNAILVGLDPTGDIALIQLQGRTDFPFAALADSDAVRPGDWCCVIGNPFLLATNLQPSVSYGIVSGVHRCPTPGSSPLEYTDAIQTDAAVNPGNSGGPMFDEQGRVMGIIGLGGFDKRGRVNVGVGYAASINQVKNFLGCLKTGRLVDHATLGAVVSSDDKGRVIVTDILSDSDAFRRGLKYGDELVAFGGKTITSVNGFKSVLGTFPKGFRVPITFQRDGKQTSTHVRLAGLLTVEELEDKARNAFREGPPQPPPMPDEKPQEPPKEGQPEEEEKNEEAKGDAFDIAEAAEQKRLQGLVETRRGMANYAFNRRERQRVTAAIAAATKWKSDSGAWQITAQNVEGQEIEISLGDQFSNGKWPRDFATLTDNGDLEPFFRERGRAPVLAALHLWRRMMTRGPEALGEVIAFGKVPVPNHAKPCDCLIVTYKTVEIHSFSDSETGLPVAAEFHLVGAGDPWELRFDDWKEAAGVMIPHTIQSVRGDGTAQTMQITAWSEQPTKVEVPPVREEEK